MAPSSSKFTGLLQGLWLLFVLEVFWICQNPKGRGTTHYWKSDRVKLRLQAILSNLNIYPRICATNNYGI